MRGHKTQSLINWLRLWKTKGYWSSWILSYGWQWVRPIWNKKIDQSKIYDLNDIAYFRKYLNQLGQYDRSWFVRIFEPETKGVRSWEYGMLLSNIGNIEGKKILDVGSGGSYLPDYLAEMGAIVTTLDIKDQMEPRIGARNRKVKHRIGDMTKMPFGDGQFDLVISVSAIEHLDNKKNYWESTKAALQEMARVTKNNGGIFLTTDFYLPEQKTDNWTGSVSKKIRGAYQWEKLADMLKIFGDNGLSVNFDIDSERQNLEKSIDFSNFRGRYFTTAVIRATKS